MGRQSTCAQNNETSEFINIVLIDELAEKSEGTDAQMQNLEKFLGKTLVQKKLRILDLNSLKYWKIQQNQKPLMPDFFNISTQNQNVPQNNKKILANKLLEKDYPTKNTMKISSDLAKMNKDLKIKNEKKMHTFQNYFNANI
ncbi:hypothetical protein BB561_005560 [Smittium simulii]|uniref:Uncharacterized protein n=1 Tax=Smittium simulii TaxID=133385 RepID=A0A2T9Y9Q9_9FUNG|nr:hypothetical protein BB561_005560 [Smittium simulii]